MAEKIETLPAKYILLEDTKGIFDGNKRSDLVRGDLLIALSEADQSEDPEKIALTGRNQEDLRVECPTSEVAKLTDSEADLLMAVTSAEERFCMYQKHLADVKSLSVGSEILVNLPKDFRGVIKYKGTLPSTDGTMFGVELCKEASGQGTTDGTFRNERYFTCSQDSGVFVAMDKIRPDMELAKSHRIKKEQFLRRSLRKVKSKIQRKKPLNIDKLKIEQSVVVFVDDKPVRGRVKWMSQIREAGGHLMVGIELEKRMGKGIGDYNAIPRFRCKKGFALFAPASTVIPEEKYNSGIVSAGEMDESSGARPKRNSTFYTELPAQENIVQGPSDKPSATQPQVQGDDQGPLQRSSAAEPKVQESPLQRSSAAEPKVQESPLGRSSTTQLAAEQKVRFVAEQLIHKGTKDKLAALRQAHEDIRSQLAAEQQAHEQTQSQLGEGQQAHQDTRKTLREVRLKLSAEKNTHEQTKMEARSNLNEAESTNLSLRQALEEFRNAREECDWMIDRNDIEISGKEIGRGAWGIVVLGYRKV